MEKCEICKKESEELFQCNSCNILFCDKCGSAPRALCVDCVEFAESGPEALKDIE